MELARDNLVTGLDDGVRPLLLQLPHLEIGDSCGLLDLGHAVDQLLVHLQPCYVEVLVGPQGLHPVIGILRHLFFPDGVVL